MGSNQMKFVWPRKKNEDSNKEIIYMRFPFSADRLDSQINGLFTILPNKAHVIRLFGIIGMHSTTCAHNKLLNSP